MIKLMHLITDLDTGGAEMMLYKLLFRMDRTAFEAEVISLTDTGPISEKIEALGVSVRALGMRRGMPNPVSVLRLALWLWRDRPLIIQTWMYHANLIGGLAAKLSGGIPVIWGIHNSTLDAKRSKWRTIWIARVCARFSRWLPARIVSCAEVSRQIHIALGYAPERMVVIPNGFDLATFRPDPAARLAVRQELGIATDASLIGLVGRFDPIKDHHNFVHAAGWLHARRPEVHFLLCGDAVTWENQQLVEWIKMAGIRDRCHLLGRQEDIPRLTAALDLASSSSYGESFPLVIGEAMACGVPCVVTDVGDSAQIVGDTGRVVPPKNPQALAEAWCELIEMEPTVRAQLGLAARHRVEEHFSLPAIVARYEKLYDELLSQLGD